MIEPELTVAFVPTLPTDLGTRLSRYRPSPFLETMVPREIKKAHVNSRKSVVGVDASTAAAVSTLLLTPIPCGMSARSYLPRGNNNIAGVIEGADNCIPDSEFTGFISSTTSVIVVRHLGTSQSVKIVFTGACLPLDISASVNASRCAFGIYTERTPKSIETCVVVCPPTPSLISGVNLIFQMPTFQGKSGSGAGQVLLYVP